MLANPVFISGYDLNTVIAKALHHITFHGLINNSRNGQVKYVNDLTLQLNDPRARHLGLLGRTSNIFQMMAETFWVMAGLGEINPFLGYFLPRAINYSDDGKTWHGAYGSRMYTNNQFDDVIKIFREDGKDTRRAIIMIANPELDSCVAIAERYGDDHKARDLPCNRELHVYVVKNKLNMKVIQRSGDMLFGAGSINPFEFSFIQEILFNKLKKELFPDLKLGVLRWTITNAHIYQEFATQVYETLKAWDGKEAPRPYDWDPDPEQFYHQDVNEMAAWTPELPIGDDINRPIFEAIVDDLTWLIQQPVNYIFNPNDLATLTANASAMDINKNIVATYFWLVAAYIIGQKVKRAEYIDESLRPSVMLYLPEGVVSASLKKALNTSKFIHFAFSITKAGSTPRIVMGD